MNPDEIYRRYQELQRYVGWTDEDAERVRSLGPLIEPHLPELIDDFYAEIERHDAARKVITGGSAQVERLKVTLAGWLRELFAGRYDRDYVARRWRVGWRHVEIGLDQVYTNVALSRLRCGILRLLEQQWPGDLRESLAVRRALNTLLDLDLAIIEDAYQTEYTARSGIERLAAIGQVAGGIAHELPSLNVVKTSVYYLRSARNPTPAKRKALRADRAPRCRRGWRHYRPSHLLGCLCRTFARSHWARVSARPWNSIWCRVLSRLWWTARRACPRCSPTRTNSASFSEI
jgi:hypothetical protein